MCNDDNEPGKQDNLRALLEHAQQRMWHHHNALWEIEKHYTWWIAGLLSGLVLLYGNDKLCHAQRLILVSLGSLFGAFMARMAWIVARREGVFFMEAMRSTHNTLLALGLQDKVKLPSRPGGADDAEGEAVQLMPDLEACTDWKTIGASSNRPWRELLKSLKLDFVHCLFQLVRPQKKVFPDEKSKIGVRDAFLLVFLVAAFLFLVFFVFAWVTLFKAAFL
mgnify:CR=1 FL=1